MATKDWDDPTLTDGDTIPTSQWIEMAGHVTTNNSKVSNATHTGDVTGATALTVSDGVITLSKLSASGTANSTTYLRGDNTWAEVTSGTSSPLTTKGDLYTYSTDNARLPVGVNGQVLSSDSSEATGLKWISAGGVGTVTSVVSGSGMDFSEITSSGTVTMGTPGSLDADTTNGVTSTSHTHSITTGISDNNIVQIDSASVADDEYARFTPNGLESLSASEVLSDIGALANLVEDDTPQLGGNLDLNGKGLSEGSETIDGGVSTGNIVYYDSSSWKQADASAEATADGRLGLYLGSNEVMFEGEYTTTGLTAGAIYYLSETAGGVTSTVPSASGAIVRPVGKAKSTTVLMFNPSDTWVELS